MLAALRLRRSFDGDWERCLDRGMDNRLSKPVNAREIEPMLKKWSRSQMQDHPRVSVDAEAMRTPVRLENHLPSLRRFAQASNQER